MTHDQKDCCEKCKDIDIGSKEEMPCAYPSCPCHSPKECNCDTFSLLAVHAHENIHGATKSWGCPVHGFQSKKFLLHTEKDETCKWCTSFAEIEEEFELDVWPSQGESLGSGIHFKRIKSFLRTALEKTQREENEKGQKEIQDAIEMSKQGWIDQGYQAGKEDALKAKNK